METCFCFCFCFWEAASTAVVTVSSCAQIWLQSIADLAKATTSHMGETWMGRRRGDSIGYISHSVVNCPRSGAFLEIRHPLCELSVSWRRTPRVSQQINLLVSQSPFFPFSLSFYIIYMPWPMATNNFCNWPEMRMRMRMRLRMGSGEEHTQNIFNSGWSCEYWP